MSQMIGRSPPIDIQTESNISKVRHWSPVVVQQSLSSRRLRGCSQKFTIRLSIEYFRIALIHDTGVDATLCHPGGHHLASSKKVSRDRTVSF